MVRKHLHVDEHGGVILLYINNLFDSRDGCVPVNDKLDTCQSKANLDLYLDYMVFSN